MKMSDVFDLPVYPDNIAAKVKEPSKLLEAISNASNYYDDLFDDLSMLVQYAEWQIREGTDHHPTLPSAISKARSTLARARGED